MLCKHKLKDFKIVFFSKRPIWYFLKQEIHTHMCLVTLTRSLKYFPFSRKIGKIVLMEKIIYNSIHILKIHNDLYDLDPNVVNDN